MQHESTPAAKEQSPNREALSSRLVHLGFADQLTISIPQAGRLLGLGETAAYAAAGRGEIPFRRFGKKKRVFVDALLAMAMTTDEDLPHKQSGARAGRKAGEVS